jgi:hypothetical protein
MSDEENERRFWEGGEEEEEQEEMEWEGEEEELEYARIMYFMHVVVDGYEEWSEAEQRILSLHFRIYLWVQWLIDEQGHLVLEWELEWDWSWV